MKGMKHVNAYVNGKLIAKDLLGRAVRENKMLNTVKAELKETFPTIEFRVERQGVFSETN